MGSESDVDEIARVLQRVVCPRGLRPAELADAVAELRPLSHLECVRARLGDQTDPLIVADAVAAAIADVVQAWPQGPSQSACLRLLGIGSTRALPRRERRRAARQVLRVGEDHFRKHREPALLRDVAADLARSGGGTPEHGPARQPAGTDSPSAPQETAAPSGQEPRTRGLLGRARGKVAVLAMLMLAVAALITLPVIATHTDTNAVARQAPIPPAPATPGPRIPGDDDMLVSENYPDGTTVRAGQTFAKTWELRNTGTVPWADRYLQRSQPATGGCQTPDRVPIPTVLPNQDIPLTVPVSTPENADSCLVTWKMTDPTGTGFFPNKPAGIYFQITVVP